MIDALQVFVRGFEDVERGEDIISYLTELGFRVKLAADGGADSLGGLIETDVVYQDELQETDPGIILSELRKRTDFNGLWLQTREFHLSDQSEYGRGDVEEHDETHDDDWIIEHADQLKEELLELAKAGAPLPEPGTVLGRALEMFTGRFGA